MQINLTKLDQELRAAGFKISGVSENGTVWDLNNQEIQAVPAVAALIKAHDPTPEPQSPSLASLISVLQAQIVEQNELIQELLING